MRQKARVRVAAGAAAVANPNNPIGTKARGDAADSKNPIRKESGKAGGLRREELPPSMRARL